jgi:hypothetical protein
VPVAATVAVWRRISLAPALAGNATPGSADTAGALEPASSVLALLLVTLWTASAVVVLRALLAMELWLREDPTSGWSRGCFEVASGSLRRIGLVAVVAAVGSWMLPLVDVANALAAAVSAGVTSAMFVLSGLALLSWLTLAWVFFCVVAAGYAIQQLSLVEFSPMQPYCMGIEVPDKTQVRPMIIDRLRQFRRKVNKRKQGSSYSDREQ